jgi:hypothetical protein
LVHLAIVKVLEREAELWGSEANKFPYPLELLKLLKLDRSYGDE